MRRRVYVVCQKTLFHKGKPEVISDGKGRLLYVFGGPKGEERGEKVVDRLNMDFTKQHVHLRKGWIEF